METGGVKVRRQRGHSREDKRRNLSSLNSSSARLQTVVCFSLWDGEGGGGEEGEGDEGIGAGRGCHGMLIVHQRRISEPGDRLQ